MGVGYGIKTSEQFVNDPATKTLNNLMNCVTTIGRVM